MVQQHLKTITLRKKFILLLQTNIFKVWLSIQRGECYSSKWHKINKLYRYSPAINSMLVWQTESYDFDYQPEPAKTIQHKTPCTRRNLLKLWLYIFSVHTALHVYIQCWTHTNTFQNHASTHANNITDAAAPYSQAVKWAGSVHLHSYGLHVCLFFPEGAPPALGEQWKSCWWCSTESVSEGGGSGARPGISNRHTESRAEDQPRPVQQQSRGEGKRPLETHCPSTRRFKTTEILFHWPTTNF